MLRQPVSGWQGRRKPQPPAPLAKQGKGATKNNIQKGFVKFWHKTFFFCLFVFCVAWNEKFVKSKWICVRLHTNSWQTFLFHAGLQIRRVKAKNASTLGFYNTKTWLIAINHKSVIQFKGNLIKNNIFLAFVISTSRPTTPRPLGRNLIKPFYCFILIFIL